MADTIGKFTLGELAKRLFQFFGLTANQAIGFDDNGKIKNVTGLGETITEGELELTDVTTANASTDKHGLMKKLSGTASEFFNGAGSFAAVTKSNVGLGSADDTADAAKPISTATQTALDLKADAANVSNVDNTSDAAKPVSTATQTALDLKHNLITPATHIADPAGAATDQDDEARAAIVSILNALEAAGIVAGA